MKLNRQQIHERAMEVLEANQQGIRWSDLLRAVQANAPGTPPNSIHGGIHNLLTTRTSEISKVARGTYQLARFVDADNAAASAQGFATVVTPVKAETPGADILTEQDFYVSFAAWLEENDEATFASALGGSSLARIIHEKCAIKAKPLLSLTTMRMGCLMKFFAMKSLAQVFGGLGRFRAVR